MADIGGLNTTQGAATAGPSFEMETQDDRQALLDAHKRNLSLGLLAAGLGMMATRGSGRHGASFAQKLGEGGLMGLQTYESGERDAEQELQRRQSARALNAYRQQEIGVRQAGVNEQSRRTDAMIGDKAEKVRHDQAQEAIQGQGKDIQQQNANTNAYRASLQAQSVALQGTRLAKEYAPGGTDVVARFRGTNVEKLVPLLDSETVKSMPKKDQDAYAKEVTAAYSRMAKDPNLNIKFEAMGDGQLHKFITDVRTGETKDTVMGKAAPKGEAGSGAASIYAEIKKSATGGSPAADAPPPVPSPATETTNATPSSPPPMVSPKLGKRIGLVDSSKFKEGGIYKSPSTGKRFIIKDGVAYEAA